MTHQPTTQTEWADYLAPGERVLWTGKPSAALSFSLERGVLDFIGGFVAIVIGGLIVSGHTFNMRSGPLQIHSGIGFLLLAVGLLQTLGPTLWSSLLRRNTRYAVTDQRALIYSTMTLKRVLKSWNIQKLSSIELVVGRHKTVWLDKTSGGTFFFPKRSKHIGFEMISDAEDVYQMLLKIQRGEH